MLTETLAPEDFKWLSLIREREQHEERKHRPLPFSVQTRLRGLGLIESRRGKLILTSAGQRVLAEFKASA
jgi:hypothetical protein